MKIVSGVGIQEVIDEEKAGLGDFSDSDDDIKNKDKRNRSDSSSSSDNKERNPVGGNSDDSSIDGGCEDDEEKLYQQIIQAQSQKGDKDAGIDDLVDKDMIELLKVCSHFSCPSLDELSLKFVNFGQPTR